MLTIQSRLRFLSNKISNHATLDLRELLTVGEAARLTEILVPIHPEKPVGSSEVIKDKIQSSIERLTASMIDRHSHVSDHTAGFYVTTDPVTCGRSNTKCMFMAEVTEVTPTEALFHVEIRDANSGAVISTAEYERVIVGEPYRLKL
jgi:hypothetical protein